MENGETVATTEAPQVPPVNWKALDGIDWSVPFIMIGIFFAFMAFGMLMGTVGFFGALWIVWTGILVWNYGIAAVFVNPLYILGSAFIMAGISWILLVGFNEVTQAPARIWRHFTR